MASMQGANAFLGLLQNQIVWANAAAALMPPEAWYEMYVKALHRELAMMGMRVLSRVISACERGCSAHEAALLCSRVYAQKYPKQARP